MTKKLLMSFRNADGNRVSLSIDDPRANVTDAEVKAAMQMVLDENIFDSNGGALVQIVDATIIETTKTDLDVEEA
ncbi:DUF2922 domain-containing protein [Gottschalkiaceae bacterium SANA]|nr:DUF2922 domain-containing protein [Gottschalkiaceae bacterium SANA]